jgi:hypothetical protein
MRVSGGDWRVLRNALPREITYEHGESTSRSEHGSHTGRHM